MNDYARSDLAVERRGTGKTDYPGTEYRERKIGNISVSELKITGTKASEKIGKPLGRYVTVSPGKLWMIGETERTEVCALISSEIRKMVKSMTGIDDDGFTEKFGVLVAGLGNEEITPDAIGPLTVRGLTVTRHLREYEPEIYKTLGFCSVSALSPGVLGQTGIETVELIRGAVENAHPDIVIVVDALVARSCDRLASTVQLADSGINPGSGIGNTRKAISAETINVPVLSIGVPTVVNSSTLVYDVLEKAGIDPSNTEIREVLETGRGFYVSPKESDIMVKRTSEILADAISAAFMTDLRI